MAESEEEFRKKLLSTFRIEADEHIKAMSAGLVQLEKESDRQRLTVIVEGVFREAHSLKGAARAVNAAEIETICQSLESTFAALKSKKISISTEFLDLLHQAVDHLAAIIPLLPQAPDEEMRLKSADLSKKLESTAGGAPVDSKAFLGKAAGSKQSVTGESPVHADTVRISTAKLDALLSQAEEMLSTKLALGQRARELVEISGGLKARTKQRLKIRPLLRAFENPWGKNGGGNGENRKSPLISKILEFLEEDNVSLDDLERQTSSLAKSVQQDHRLFGNMVDGFLEDMKKVLMLPFQTLLEAFPKLIRDLSRDRGKEVDFVVRGAEIEIDRRILEELKDPLIHLIRNCVDHGIENPEDRKRKKKTPQGTVTIEILQRNGNKVEICVFDDGAGIDVEKVCAAALKLGIASEKNIEQMTNEEKLALIFHSGISTSPMITDLSGCGLGLAIARERVEMLNGGITVQTHPTGGTAFRMVLPLTLATFRGILIQSEGYLFIFPTVYVERVLNLENDSIGTVENRETISLDEEAVSLVFLRDVLELPLGNKEESQMRHVPAVVVGSAGTRIAFAVDEILGEQEVMVKGLGKHLVRVRNIGGASVLGTGKVVPILNVPDLVKSIIKTPPVSHEAVKKGANAEAKKKNILVSEDSITARTLLKNILETAGYRVKTAVDGMDALTQLRTEEFDLVVSDVDMPRMGGFDLTAKIRADKKFMELPVVLVTALESREDRERGIDVGANAYIVKSSFDQSNLLEIIKRFL